MPTDTTEDEGLPVIEIDGRTFEPVLHDLANSPDFRAMTFSDLTALVAALTPEQARTVIAELFKRGSRYENLVDEVIDADAERTLAMSDEEFDAEILAGGGDPEKLKRWGAATGRWVRKLAEMHSALSRAQADLAEAEGRAEVAERELARLKARKFPVLMGADSKELRAFGCPMVVPWDFIADNARMCEQNHSQTPERLAERGGLAPCEMCAVVEGRRWMKMTNEESAKRLLELLAAYAKEPTPTAAGQTGEDG